MYQVVFTKQAVRNLRKTPKQMVLVIREKVAQIATDPYAQHSNVAKLVGRPGYRLRVGDWRVIYELHDGQMVLLVIKIGPRGEVYE